MMWIVDELRKLSEFQPNVVEEILQDVKEKHPDLHRSMVIGAYVDDKISLGKAAELLGITRNELEREFKEKGIPLRALHKEDVIAEVDAIKKWRE